MCVAAVLIFASPFPSAAEPVAQVLEVRVEGDPAAYMKVVQQLDALSREITPAVKIRTWRALLAGEDAGSLLIVIEHPSLEDYAAHRTKLQGHEGWAKLLQQARESGRRRVSNSLLVEVTP
jgi:hypothetical protein